MAVTELVSGGSPLIKPVKKSLFIIFGKEYVKAIASINYFNIIAPVEYSYTQGRETHSHLDVFPSV